jgi:hypothetical protein
VTLLPAPARMARQHSMPLSRHMQRRDNCATLVRRGGEGEVTWAQYCHATCNGVTALPGHPAWRGSSGPKIVPQPPFLLPPPFLPPSSHARDRHMSCRRRPPPPNSGPKSVYLGWEKWGESIPRRWEAMN